MASGGPNADDHPELHRLLVEHDQNSTMNDLGSKTTTKYRGPKNPVTSQHIADSEVRGAVAAASVAGASRRADGGQQGDCLATSGFLSDVEHASGVEGGGSSVEPKGPGKGVVLGTDDDDGGIALSGKICPW